MLTFPEIERALVVTAHPDDVDFGAAGTVAMMTDAGVEVTYCLVTDGDAGGSDRTMARHDMAMLRRKEQTDGGQRGRCHAAVLPRLRRRSCAGHPATARRHQRGHPPGSAARRHHPVAASATSTASTPAIPTTSPPARRRCAPCTPTPATRSRSPSCSQEETRAVGGRRGVGAGGGDGNTSDRRHRQLSTARSPR